MAGKLINTIRELIPVDVITSILSRLYLIRLKVRSNPGRNVSEVAENSIQVRGKLIPVDVVEAILSKLPVKSLIRFQLLSKSWKATISNPWFLKINYNHLSKSRNLFLCDMEDTEELGFCSMKLNHNAILQTEADLRAPFGPAVPLSSCNGIILLAPWKRSYGGFVLWNPSIRRYTMIPIPLRNMGWMNAGLYHDSRTDDYKVAVISENHNLVFSCKTRTWAKEALIPCDRSTIFGVVDGCLYWQDNGGIMCFDFRVRKTGRLELPEETIGRLRLAALRGRLCLKTEHRVWVRKNNGWRDLSNVLKTGVHYIDTLVHVLLEGNKAVYVTFCSHLVIYNDCEKRFREWEIPALLLSYSESLFFPF